MGTLPSGGGGGKRPIGAFIIGVVVVVVVIFVDILDPINFFFVSEFLSHNSIYYRARRGYLGLQEGIKGRTST